MFKHLPDGRKSGMRYRRTAVQEVRDGTVVVSEARRGAWRETALARSGRSRSGDIPEHWPAARCSHPSRSSLRTGSGAGEGAVRDRSPPVALRNGVELLGKVETPVPPVNEAFGSRRLRNRPKTRGAAALAMTRASDTIRLNARIRAGGVSPLQGRASKGSARRGGRTLAGRSSASPASRPSRSRRYPPTPRLPSRSFGHGRALGPIAL